MCRIERAGLCTAHIARTVHAHDKGNAVVEKWQYCHLDTCAGRIFTIHQEVFIGTDLEYAAAVGIDQRNAMNIKFESAYPEGLPERIDVRLVKFKLVRIVLYYGLEMQYQVMIFFR